MKAKYVEERYPLWYVFGWHKDRRVDVTDGKQDVMGHVAEDDVTTAISEHNQLVNAMVQIAQAWNASDPEAFKRYWYAQTRTTNAIYDGGAR